MTVKIETQKTIKLLLLTGFLLLIGFSFIPAKAMSANYPLEIINIKPAGTGDPAIPETNRIFRAYPGIEYNIRPAVIGGLYPYEFSLSNAPSGMSINSDTGEITWTDPQSDTGTITLSVTDAEGTTQSAEWSIDVKTNGFLFVDSSALSNGDGTKSSPYSSLENMLTDTLNTGQETDIVYFRGGTYDMVDHNSDNDNVMRIDDNPTNWLAYPEETVVLQGSAATGQAYRINPHTETFYFDGLTIKDTVAYGITVYGQQNYYTIRRCLFDTLTIPDTVNRNYGFIHSSVRDPASQYTVIQDNEFHSWNGLSAIGSLYGEDKILIEDNYIHTPIKPYKKYTVGISVKSSSDHVTIRRNKVIMQTGTPIAHSTNSLFSASNDIEICFNFFDNRESDWPHTIHEFNTNRTQGETYYYRNTTAGGKTYIRFYQGDNWENVGPFNFYDNVIVSSENQLKTYDDPKVTYTDNLDGDLDSGIIDSEGNLTSNYSEYVGIKGHQIDEGQQDTTSSTDDNDLGRPLNPKIVTQDSNN